MTKLRLQTKQRFKSGSHNAFTEEILDCVKFYRW